MKVGRKGQGQRGNDRKDTNIRHGHGPKRGCNAAEKAVETKLRQDAKKAIAREVAS